MTSRRHECVFFVVINWLALIVVIVRAADGFVRGV